MGFANDIIGGAAALIRAAIKSPNYVLGSAGWSINKDGTAEFNNATVRGTLSAATIVGSLIESASSGRRTTIDASGDIKVYNASGAVLMWFVNADDAQFFYADTGSSTQGALVCSIANAAGTDPFGTTYVTGIGVYITIGLTKYVLTFGSQNSFPAMSVQQASSGPVLPVLYAANAASSAGCSAYISSGISTVSDAAAQLQVEDSKFSGVTNGQIELLAGRVNLGLGGNAWWSDGLSQLLLGGAGMGPFINGETFHNISLPAGLSGTFRIKLLPWNAVWIDCILSVSNTNTTFNCGSLPSAGYYPLTARVFPLVGSSGTTGWIFVPTSGGVNIRLNASASGQSVGTSVMYPPN
jgi:hypothetical protein